MSLFNSNLLVMEQRWNFGSHLWRSSYQVSVYNEQHVLVASVADRSKSALSTVLRGTDLSGVTFFDLKVTSPDGQVVLLISKGTGSPPVQVRDSQSRLIGQLWQTQGRAWQAGYRAGAEMISLHDPEGEKICLLSDIARLDIWSVQRSEGKRVRRDELNIRPDVTHPLRELAVAAGVAFDIVVGAGTKYTQNYSADGLAKDIIRAASRRWTKPKGAQ